MTIKSYDTPVWYEIVCIGYERTKDLRKYDIENIKILLKGVYINDEIKENQ